MLGMPSARAGDWNFRLLGFPIRVSLYFWLMAVLMGPKEPRGAVLWVPAVFFSILIHEMGHGFVARLFGFHSKIVLYEFGGLCASEAERQSSNQRIAILLGGPGAQLVLLVILMLVGARFLDISFEESVSLAKIFLGLPAERISPNTTQTAFELYVYLFQINWLWPLLNLLPIWPLDGGQITGEVLARFNRRDGKRWGHIVSMVTAGLLAVYAVSRTSPEDSSNTIFRVLLFGSLAFANFQILQAYQQRHRMYGPDDDPDWWARG